jgi:hypothetical protein
MNPAALASTENSKKQTNMKQLASLLLIAALAAGCTHTARITNAKKFTPVETRPAKRVTLGITPITDDRLLTAAVNKVKADASITDCKENFHFGAEFKPDYVCQLSRETKFKAAGQNFFITFPGFIIFTHALAGYKYTADITTHSTITDLGSNQVSQAAIHTPIEFRHCSFARGAAAGCFGWLLPGYGAAAIIPGAIFASSYDKRATTEFMEKAEQTYAGYVSSRVLEQLSHAQSTELKSPAASNATVAPSSDPDGIAAENEYAVYVMKVNGNEVGQPEVGVKELPASVRQTLNAMGSKGVVADSEALEEVLISLGASPSEFFGHLDRAEVFTQVDERIVQLQKLPQAGSSLF